jgi:hypothetical protein
VQYDGFQILEGQVYVLVQLQSSGVLGFAVAECELNEFSRESLFNPSGIELLVEGGFEVRQRN